MTQKDKQIWAFVKDILNLKNLDELAVLLGYKPTTSRNWTKNSESGFSLPVVKKIKEAVQKKLTPFKSDDPNFIKFLELFVDIEIEESNDYTVTSTGSMFAAEDNAVYGSSVAMNIYYDLYFSAGGGNPFALVDPKKVSLDRKFLQNFYNIVNFEKTDIVRVSGNSMCPTINDGDFMFVERGTEPKNGDMVIARVENELYVKRFHKEPFGGDIRLISDNTEYKPIVLDTDEKKDQLEVYGIVKSRVVLY